MRHERPDIDSYFMNIAIMVSSRTTCMRRSVGSVIVKGKQIVSTVYNGAPQGMPHCLEIGCAREGVPSGERSELFRVAHAEQNAIIQCAIHGASTEGATLYSTLQPCILCTKIMLNSGIRRVVFSQGYPDDESISYLKEGGVEIVHLQSPKAPSSDQ